MGRKTGHFRLESGHHADLWLELDQLFLRPSALQPFVRALAERIGRHDVQLVCGPLTGGAFLAQLIAAQLELSFAYTERAVSERSGLYPVDYRIASAMRERINGRRVAIVDDAISAGSAVRGTIADLVDCGGEPAVIAALITMGNGAEVLAKDLQLPLERLVQLADTFWPPTECPMCALGAPLTEP